MADVHPPRLQVRARLPTLCSSISPTDSPQMLFPIDLFPDDDGAVLATCPLLPEVAVLGESVGEARHRVVEAIEDAIAARMAAGRDVPRPPNVPCATGVRISSHIGVKLALAWALSDSGCSRDDLGRRLGCGRKEVDRLFRLDHATRLDRLEAACRMLGRELQLEVC
jgi:antitoxin HicB